MSEDMVSEPNGSTESKKREAKGTCLKIEGQDGYVFKSYSINPHETVDEKSPACSSVTLDKDSPPSFHLSSQDEKQLESDQASETDPASPTLSSKCLNTNAESNMESEKYENLDFFLICHAHFNQSLRNFMHRLSDNLRLCKLNFFQMYESIYET